MNRNQMYEYLKSCGMYPVMHRRTRKTYHMEFRLDRNKSYEYTALNFKYGYIRNISSIYLCANEIVVVSKYEDMMINIPYKYLKEVEIKLIEYE